MHLRRWKRLEEQVNHHLLVRMKNFNRTWNRPIRCHATPKSPLNHQFQIKWAVQSDRYMLSNIHLNHGSFKITISRLEWPCVFSSTSLLEFCVIWRAHIASKKCALLKYFLTPLEIFNLGQKSETTLKMWYFFDLFSFKFKFLKIEHFKQL